MHRAHLIQLLLALAGAAVFAHPALAWGEPKNQPPFTHSAPQQRSLAAAPQGTSAGLHGESKNQLPFTRRATP